MFQVRVFLRRRDIGGRCRGERCTSVRVPASSATAPGTRGRTRAPYITPAGTQRLSPIAHSHTVCAGGQRHGRVPLLPPQPPADRRAASHEQRHRLCATTKSTLSYSRYCVTAPVNFHKGICFGRLLVHTSARSRSNMLRRATRRLITALCGGGSGRGLCWRSRVESHHV